MYQITRIGLSVPHNTAEVWGHDTLKESLTIFVSYKDSYGELRTQTLNWNEDQLHYS